MNVLLCCDGIDTPSQVRHRISNNVAIYREFIEYNIVHRHN